MTRHALEVESPLGTLQLVGEANYLVELNWAGRHKQINPSSIVDTSVLSTAADQLTEFLAGSRNHFTVPIKPMGTDFQLSVWSELQKVGWGVTRTYRDIAEQLGKPTGSRAIGGAVGRNPIPIFIPCHRIIGSAGSLTGFSGGLKNKQILLQCEGHQIQA